MLCLASLLLARSAAAQTVDAAGAEPPRPETAPRAEQIYSPTPGGTRVAEVVRAAQAVAPDVAAASTSLREAEARVGAARAGMLPRIDVSASYTRLSEVDTPPLSFGGQVFDSPFTQILDQYSARASVQVPVTDLILRAAPSYRLVAAAADVAALQIDAQREAAAWQATEAYYGWVRSIVTRNVAAESVRLVEATAASVRALADAGVVPRVDVATAQAGVDGARTALASAEAGVAYATDALRALTGGTTDLVVDAPGEDLLVGSPTGPVPDTDATVAAAMANRVEVRALRELVDISERERAIRRTSELPSLSVSAGALYANPNPRVNPQHQEFDGSWDIGATVSWSPNDWRSTRAALDVADAAVDRARDDLAAFEMGVRLQAAEAVANWRMARASIDGASAQVESAATDFEARRAAIAAGVGTTTELLAAQRALVAAWLDVFDGYIALRRADAQLARVEGRLALGEEE